MHCFALQAPITLQHFLSFRNLTSCVIWVVWSPTGKQKPSCCFWIDVVITCVLLFHLIKEEKLILESWDWNPHQKRCKVCRHTHTVTCTYTHIMSHRSINTQTSTHQRKSPEAHSLIELSHLLTVFFFHTLFIFLLFLNQQRVRGCKKKDRETKKEAVKEKWAREERGKKKKLRWISREKSRVEVLDG